MTALQPHPRPENPEKGENPGAGEDGKGFLSLLPFPGPGIAQNAPASGAAAALVAVRSYRRQPPPEPPRAPRRQPEKHNGTRAGGSGAGLDAHLPASAPLPGVPPDWCEGVARLAIKLAPDSILPARWAVLAATAARLLREHGTELHAAGWTVLDLFGLHATAPATYSPGWGLAWLLGEAGSVLDVSPAVMGIALRPGGARLSYKRPGSAARAGIVPAWLLSAARGVRLIEVTA